MKAYLLKVAGKVQRVGYRRHVLELGQELELAGYVRNEKDGTVTIFAQGDEETLNRFMEALKTPPPPAKIKKIEIAETRPKPNLKHFQIRYNKLADELQEGFGAMQAIFYTYWEEFRDYRGEFRDYRSEFRDFRNEFRDFRGEFRDFRNEFRDFRGEFREFRGEFNDFRNEFRDFRDEFRDYRMEFREFVNRMDAFVERVTRVLEALTEQSKRSMEILEVVARDSRETREMLLEALKMLREVVGKAGEQL